VVNKQHLLNALDSLIEEGRSISDQFVIDLVTWPATFPAWQKACESTLELVYGSGSNALFSFRAIQFFPPASQSFANDAERDKANLIWFNSGLQYSIRTLTGYRYSIELLSDGLGRPNKNVFVSHGGPTRTHVDTLRDLLIAIGLQPFIVADQPNMNLSVNEKVRWYMDVCDSAVVLATAEDEVVAAAEKRAKPNVENEIGLLQASQYVGNRIAYLKESEVKFASNYSEKVWIEFRKESLQDSFVELLRELNAFGLFV